MQILCPCGETLSDTSDSLSYKGTVLPDAEYTAAFEAITEGMKAFSAAVAAGRREEWLTRQFGPGWPQDLPDADHLDEYVHDQIMRRSRLVYECWRCGRLLVQARRGDFQLVAFSPDQAGYHRVLTGHAAGEQPDEPPATPDPGGIPAL
jgi:hypothetical protein